MVETMNPSTVDALADLRALMARGVPERGTSQRTLDEVPARQSAVLVLFGERTVLGANATGDGSGSGSSAAALSSAARVAAGGGRACPGIDDIDVLLTRRASGMRHHAGQIAFPGGGVEAGDNSMAHTALREAEEETGLDPASVDVLGALPRVHVAVSRNMVTPVVGWWHTPAAVAADHSESVDVFRVPVATLLDPAVRGTSVISRGGLTHRGAAFQLPAEHGGHIVWGFTGMVLARLFDDLGWGTPWDRRREFRVTV